MARSLTARLGLQRWTADSDTQSRSDFDSSNLALETLVAIARHGNLTSRPAAGTRDQLYFATDVGRIFWDDGTAWHLVHVVDPLLDQNTDPTGTGTINTLTAVDVLVVSPTIPAGVTRVKISGTVWISTPAGVGAVVQLTGMSDAKSRTISAGSESGDVGIPFAYDLSPTAGVKNYRLRVASTVSGSDVTWRAPMLTAEILG
jgi:hypothetical protein